MMRTRARSQIQNRVHLGPMAEHVWRFHGGRVVTIRRRIGNDRCGNLLRVQVRASYARKGKTCDEQERLLIHGPPFEGKINIAK